MPKRNFDNFLDSYFDYARDEYCPDDFHLWTGLSIVAGALGRKVWLPWSTTFNHYPNIYVILIANPGVGKSSACNIGMKLLQNLDRMKFIPTQITLAKLIAEMSEADTFEISTQIFKHSSGYFYASEASNSFQEVHGDIVPCFTDFYDCPTSWEKGTMKDGKVVLENVCFNILAASTFNYLGKLINDDSIMGGFASRLIYVIHDEHMARTAKWGYSDNKEKGETFRLLLSDLQQINSLTGKYNADEEFKETWRAWSDKNDEERQEIKSEKMQSLLARKNTNVMKLCMIISACEGNDLLLTKKVWDRAVSILGKTEPKLPRLLRLSQSQDKGAQSGLVQEILQFMDLRKSCTEGTLLANLNIKGFDPQKIKPTLNFMQQGDEPLLHQTMNSTGDFVLKLIGNPNDYL